MIAAGDKIKVIPKSYAGMAKAFLNTPDAWEEADAETNRRIMLGGSYIVLGVRRAGSGTCFKVLKNPISVGEISEYDVVPESEVEPCPFSVGDLVEFQPRCAPQDLAFLRSIITPIYLDEAGANVHEVTDVLNGFYVFLDVPKRDQQAFPFRWDDLQPAKSFANSSARRQM